APSRHLRVRRCLSARACYSYRRPDALCRGSPLVGSLAWVRSFSESCGVGCSSLADLSGAAYHEFGRREALSAHGTIGVKACRGDSDLGAEPQLATIGKSRGCVDHHGRRIHFADEPVRDGWVGGDDRLGMTGTIALDVGDGSLD